MAVTETEPQPASPPWADSAAAWRDRLHDAILPSGQKVTYRDLSIVEMATIGGELPGDLLELALAEWGNPGSSLKLASEPLAQLPEKPSKKQLATAEDEVRANVDRIAQVNRHLVAAALVEPKLTVEELENVPYVDLELLSRLINRVEIFDAADRRVGVVPLDFFRVVLEEHNLEPCPPGCLACAQAGRRLSTVRGG